MESQLAKHKGLGMAFYEYEPRQTLFHYTSPDAFKNILASKKLWLSDLTKSNDPRELELGHNHVIEALKSVRHTEYEGYRGLFLSILAGRLAGLRASHTAFSCCFTYKGDSLPLWNEYTGHKGLAIGFRPTAIRNIQARVQKIKYLSVDSPSEIRQKILDIAEPYNPDILHDDLEFWVNASVDIFSILTSSKHSTWEYEDEVRSIHLQENYKRETDNDLLYYINGIDPCLNPKYRKRGDEDISYIEAPFGQYNQGDRAHCRAIQSITIGPKCELSSDEVNYLLQSNGYESVLVRKSDCIIR